MLREVRCVARSRATNHGIAVGGEVHDATFGATTHADDTLTGQQVVDITLAARYFERFGDHAVAVANRVIYLVTGELATPRRSESSRQMTEGPVTSR